MNWRVCSESYKFSKIFPFQKGLSLICSSGHFFPAWQPWRKTFVNVPETSLLSRKPWNFEQFLSETLLCKCSSGHIEISFDIPAQFFPVNSKFFLVNVQNWWQISYAKTFFRKFFSDGHLCNSFDKRAIIFFKKSPSFSAQSPNNWKKTVFQSKVPTNVSYKHVHCCFGSPR